MFHVLKSLFDIQTLCCGYSKESSQSDDSFENTQHRIVLSNKRTIVGKRPVHFLKSSPQGRTHISKPYREVVIDEYYDSIEAVYRATSLDINKEHVIMSIFKCKRSIRVDPFIRCGQILITYCEVFWSDLDEIDVNTLSNLHVE